MPSPRLTLSCEEATRLLSEGQDRPLGATERTVLRMHTWVCSGCRQFGHQLGFVRRAVHSFAQREDTAPEPGPDQPN